MSVAVMLSLSPCLRIVQYTMVGNDEAITHTYLRSKLTDQVFALFNDHYFTTSNGNSFFRSFFYAFTEF